MLEFLWSVETDPDPSWNTSGWCGHQGSEAASGAGRREWASAAAMAGDSPLVLPSFLSSPVLQPELSFSKLCCKFSSCWIWPALLAVQFALKPTHFLIMHVFAACCILIWWHFSFSVSRWELVPVLGLESNLTVNRYRLLSCDGWWQNKNWSLRRKRNTFFFREQLYLKEQWVQSQHFIFRLSCGQGQGKNNLCKTEWTKYRAQVSWASSSYLIYYLNEIIY